MDGGIYFFVCMCTLNSYSFVPWQWCHICPTIKRYKGLGYEFILLPTITQKKRRKLKVQTKIAMDQHAFQLPLDGDASKANNVRTFQIKSKTFLYVLKQASLFSFYALPSSSKLKDAIIHWKQRSNPGHPSHYLEDQHDGLLKTNLIILIALGH